VDLKDLKSSNWKQIQNNLTFFYVALLETSEVFKKNIILYLNAAAPIFLFIPKVKCKKLTKCKNTHVLHSFYIFKHINSRSVV